MRQHRPSKVSILSVTIIAALLFGLGFLLERVFTTHFNSLRFFLFPVASILFFQLYAIVDRQENLFVRIGGLWPVGILTLFSLKFFYKGEIDWFSNISLSGFILLGTELSRQDRMKKAKLAGLANEQSR